MTLSTRWLSAISAIALALFISASLLVTSRELGAQAPAFASRFDQEVKPFLTKYCANCHNADNPTAGVRVDNLDASVADPQVRFWQGIRHRVENGTMPPKGLPQPGAEVRHRVTAWIGEGLEVARLRPAPKNGVVRRLTVPQYRNTLRELLQIDDDFTEILPPDAVSKDGFINNTDTLHLSPLLIEAYLEIEKLRLGPRLSVEMSIAESARPVRIPVLSVQSLVENAIKHAIATQPKGGALSISAQPSGDSVVIRVSDTGPGFGAPGETKGTGIGLDNVGRRLRLCYGPDAGLRIESSPRSGTSIGFDVPWEVRVHEGAHR